MKKLIVALAVAGAAGMVMAQSGSAECAGAASNPSVFPDYCFGGPRGEGHPGYQQGYRILQGVPSGGYAVTPYGAYGNPWGIIAQALPYGTVPYASQYPRTRNDRDGDGIRNRRDRYPDDPRYR